MQEKIMEYLKKTENPYMLKIGDMVVNIEYLKIAKNLMNVY